MERNSETCPREVDPGNGADGLSFYLGAAVFAAQRCSRSKNKEGMTKAKVVWTRAACISASNNVTCISLNRQNCR